MASVAMNGGTRSLMMGMALWTPQTAPTSAATATATGTLADSDHAGDIMVSAGYGNGGGKPRIMTAVERTPASARIAPTERSMPPVMMTIVTPTPRIVLTEVWRTTFERLRTVR